jgi:hypothetical protein
VLLSEDEDDGEDPDVEDLEDDAEPELEEEGEDEEAWSLRRRRFLRRVAAARTALRRAWCCFSRKSGCSSSGNSTVGCATASCFHIQVRVLALETLHERVFRGALKGSTPSGASHCEKR